VKTTNDHMGQDLESREDVPTPPSPNVATDFAHHDGDEVLRAQEQNGTTLQQFWLFTVKSRPHSIRSQNLTSKCLQYPHQQIWEKKSSCKVDSTRAQR
jgi:hypothetical protein